MGQRLGAAESKAMMSRLCGLLDTEDNGARRSHWYDNANVHGQFRIS